VNGRSAKAAGAAHHDPRARTAGSVRAIARDRVEPTPLTKGQTFVGVYASPSPAVNGHVVRQSAILV
jgi:hypothetical protein